MLVDLILLLLAGVALFTGFHRGFLRTLFSTVGYIGGGVLGLALSLHYLSKVGSQINKFALALAAIFLGAEIGRRICGSLAHFFRTKILWAPLRFIDSVAGAFLELIRTAILAYLLISLNVFARHSNEAFSALRMTAPLAPRHLEPDSKIFVAKRNAGRVLRCPLQKEF